MYVRCLGHPDKPRASIYLAILFYTKETSSDLEWSDQKVYPSITPGVIYTADFTESSVEAEKTYSLCIPKGLIWHVLLKIFNVLTYSITTEPRVLQEQIYI